MSAPILVTRKQQEQALAEKQKRWGAAALVVILVLFFMPRLFEEAPREGPQRLPPEPKTVVFRVDPGGVRGTTIVLTSDDGEQQVVPNRTPTELRLAGIVHWTVVAPGFRGAHGNFEVPYGASNRVVTLEVKLAPSSIARRQNSRGFGRISTGGAR